MLETYQVCCNCCGFVREYPDAKSAVEADWDLDPAVCPLCPFDSGHCDHSAAHERWKREGRPDEFMQIDMPVLPDGLSAADLVVGLRREAVPA